MILHENKCDGPPERQEKVTRKGDSQQFHCFLTRKAHVRPKSPLYFQYFTHWGKGEIADCHLFSFSSPLTRRFPLDTIPIMRYIL
jgi:hypothetical protein